MEDNQLIFCIGYNKSGTTSLYQAITDLGFKGYSGEMMANAEYLLKDVIVEQLLHQHQKEFNVVCDWVEECKLKTQKASNDNNSLTHMNVFKDVPFSLPGVWKKLYERYPNAKYILTERDSAKQWFNSITKFHQDGWLANPNTTSPVTWQQLAKVKYRFNSFAYDYIMYINTHGLLKTDSNYPYDDQLKNSYILHNKEVKEFFADKNNFLSVNVAKDSDYLKLCSFLNKKAGNPFPTRRGMRHKPIAKFPRLKITNDPSTWNNLS